MLYGTNKHIELLDIPSGYERNNDSTTDVYETLDTKNKSFNDFLRDLSSQCDGGVARLDKREDYISEKLRALLQDLSKRKANDEQIHVLLTLGAIHTRLFERFVSDLSLRCVGFKQVFSTVPQPYYYGAELMRKKLSGQEISKELLGKVFLEDIFELHIDAMTSFTDSNKTINLTRSIIEQFSFEDMQEVYETWNDEKVGRFVAIEIMKTEGYQEN